MNRYYFNYHNYTPLSKDITDDEDIISSKEEDINNRGKYCMVRDIKDGKIKNLKDTYESFDISKNYILPKQDDGDCLENCDFFLNDFIKTLDNIMKNFFTK
jgi:hypothetical protein